MDALNTIKFVLRHPRRALHHLRNGKRFDTRFVYSVAEVAPQGPLGNAVTYLDHCCIREALREVSEARKVWRALEVGCGYGRVLMVLSEFADEVIGIEREPELAELAQQLLPDVRILQQPSILTLPAVADGSCDFVMTFTVLQHMVDDDVRAVLAEIKRVTAPGGFALLVEKVEAGNETERTDDRTLFLSTHRPTSVYAAWMAPFSLTWTRPRPAPAAWNRNSGVAMLFRNDDRE